MHPATKQHDFWVEGQVLAIFAQGSIQNPRATKHPIANSVPLVGHRKPVNLPEAVAVGSTQSINPVGPKLQGVDGYSCLYMCACIHTYTCVCTFTLTHVCLCIRAYTRVYV